MGIYYKTGEFAKMANLSIRTIRYYDKIGLLKPSKIADNGYRLYTNKEFMKLQKILSLKSLGFSLDDIFSMTVNDNYLTLSKSLDMQKRMIDQKIEQLQNMKISLDKINNYIDNHDELDWKEILQYINFTGMEKDLIKQYKDSTNVDIRIKLHEKYSQNPEHWFEWLYSQYHLKNHMKVLEIGCGNGALWVLNKKKFKPKHIDLTLSDISQGMIEDAKNNLKDIKDVQYRVFDCHHIPYSDNTFDVVIANHMLFYVSDINQVLSEIYRVLKPGGTLHCSTYGKEHMKEITDLVTEYNPKIKLSNIKLYEIFGLENGMDILKKYFNHITLSFYHDYLLVDDSIDIINYILSCHGNQVEYILNDYNGFEKLVKKRMNKQMKITKEAGVFICKKEA